MRRTFKDKATINEPRLQGISGEPPYVPRCPITAQSTERHVLPPQRNGTLAFGGGAEAALWKGLGVNSEVGYLAPTAGLSDGFGLFSMNASYFISRSHRVVPFFTGGYSLSFRNGTANMANVGAGFTYWASQHHGVRLEGRDHLPTEGPTTHFVSFRIGYAFR